MAAPAPLLVGICGSRAASLRTRTLVDATLAEAARVAGAGALRTLVIDLRELDLPMCDGRPPEAYDEGTRRVLDTLVGADMYVIGTPVYRGSYTGALKNLFDLLPSGVGDDSLRGRPAALVATGGSDHHHLVVEHQLRPLAGFFGLSTTPTAVYATPRQFDGGRIADATLDGAVRRMAAELVALHAAGLATAAPAAAGRRE
jgi:MsuE subfamily FMN reductase